MDRTAILLRTPIFGDLDAEAVAILLPDLRERTFTSGQSVWFEGDPATDLYVVAEGQLKSHRVSRDGAEVILAFHPAVDVTGEVGLFHPSGVRRVNVTAMATTLCLCVGREPLLAFMSRHPEAMLRMLERLSTLTVKAAYSFSNMAFEDIRRRTARAILALADEFGEPTDQGTRIRLQLSQGTLAAMVAASRENVNRALSSFVACGAVSQQDGHFHLHDRAALERAREPS